jgi:hypothetical protein
MELRELQELMNELLQAIQLTLSSGEQLPDDMLGQIAEVLELLYNRIEELSQPGTGQPVRTPPIEPGRPSSNVNGMAYDPATQSMYVKFLGKYPNAEGPTYLYDHVPPQIAQLLQSGAVPARTDGRNRWGRWWKGKVPSAGASVHTLLKNQAYNYHRIG